MKRFLWGCLCLVVLGSATATLAVDPHLFVPKSSLPEGFVMPKGGLKVPLKVPGWLGTAPDPNPDENEPDKGAWQLFAEINKQAPTQQQVGPDKVSTNNAVWETWADDDLTFPKTPDPSKPPQWPASAAVAPAKQLMRPAQKLIRLLLKEGKPLTADALRIHPGGPTAVTVGGSEEVRRNKSSFQFIVDNKLFYRQGLAQAFAAGKTVVFPVDAIEVKANWVPIDEAQKPQYHWNYDSNGTLYGLVAMHIMTKRLPNWTWATFEWQGNLGRCDYIGCVDTFGGSPANVPPKTPLGGIYPAGSLTPQLLSLFSAAGLGDEWKNYRLKGTQTLFTDTTGRPLLLGNSVTEAGFVQTSSCITCHGQAAVDKNGAPNPTIGFTSGGQSTNGPLLGGQVKTGQSWTGQNRPVAARARRVAFTEVGPRGASWRGFSCASSSARR